MGMHITSHLTNARRYIQEQWPTYVFGFGGGAIASMIILWLSISRGWYSFIIIAFALILLTAYFFLASLWRVGYSFDIRLLRNSLFDLGNLQPEESLVQICLGRRYIPAIFSRRLTTGHVLVLDIYHPQITPGRGLARARHRAQFPVDPRLSWRDGSMNLLPLPDASAKNVILVHIASEYWQHGDQMQLFLELFRILAPDGQLLIAESIRSPTSLLTGAFVNPRLHSAKYWESILIDAGFRQAKRTIIKDLVYCWRFVKPPADEPEQLLLEL